MPIKEKDLEGKIAIVTGSAGLLGKYFIKCLAENGATVIAADYNEEKCVLQCNELGHSNIHPIFIDVTDPKSIEKTFSDVESRFGLPQILVNGAYKHTSISYEMRSAEEFESILRVNLSGVFYCCQTAGRFMKKAGGGSIINIGSIYGIVSADPRLYGTSGLNSPDVYAASKGGVIQLTRYLAVHMAKDNIRVNSISPGGIYNNQEPGFVERYNQKVPLGRMAKAEELCGPLLFLATTASSYVTGHNLVVDGGFTIW